MQMSNHYVVSLKQTVYVSDISIEKNPIAYHSGKHTHTHTHTALLGNLFAE